MFETTVDVNECVLPSRTGNTMAKIKSTKGHTTIYKTYI
jgi:hypothetical protein